MKCCVLSCKNYLDRRSDAMDGITFHLSASGRIISLIWWFFALIVICSYTANLTSYLTLARIGEPTQVYSKLSTCPEDTEGAIKGSNQEKTVDDHGWLAYLVEPTNNPEKIKPCEMLVTLSNPGIKDFAVGLPKGSLLRDGVNLALQSLKNDDELPKLVRKWFTKTNCDIADMELHGAEMTLSQVAGLFYVLLGGLALSLVVSVAEFCYYGRAEAARANISLRAALRAKSRLNYHVERKTQQQQQQQLQRTPQREHDRTGWNGGAYAGYYSPANQIGQEETALHSSFTQV